MLVNFIARVSRTGVFGCLNQSCSRYFLNTRSPSTLLAARNHSASIEVTQSDMKVYLFPALSDNYMYLLVDEKSATRVAVVFDPAEPEKVVDFAKKNKIDIKYVLTTHHHADHAGGNEEIAKLLPGISIYGGDDRILSLTNLVRENEEFKIGKLNVKCLSTPCHTRGHICYYITGDDQEPAAVFTGDTLFVGGCGRFFEGYPEQMYKNLVETLGNLPDDTRVYCGHEYTVNNLKYGLHVEPNNKDIQNKLSWAKAQRDRNEPTIPSTIGEEKLYNPFMRVGETSVQEHVKQSDKVATMGALRDEKDGFKPS